MATKKDIIIGVIMALAALLVGIATGDGDSAAPAVAAADEAAAMGRDNYDTSNNYGTSSRSTVGTGTVATTFITVSTKVKGSVKTNDAIATTATSSSSLIASSHPTTTTVTSSSSSTSTTLPSPRPDTKPEPGQIIPAPHQTNGTDTGTGAGVLHPPSLPLPQEPPPAGGGYYCDPVVAGMCVVGLLLTYDESTMDIFIFDNTCTILGAASGLQWDAAMSVDSRLPYAVVVSPHVAVPPEFWYAGSHYQDGWTFTGISDDAFYDKMAFFC